MKETNPDHSAFARPFSKDAEELHCDYYEDQKGLTKREYFAAMALQGILASADSSYIPAAAADFADVLIKALNKDKK